mmetsp:Transcript_7678/g.14495  ORF Transcript_7678/g.14495 Transcript_7678/m.14495 type:complete len:374 (-) Transcript_7678:1062-2183(-)
MDDLSSASPALLAHIPEVPADTELLIMERNCSADPQPSPDEGHSTTSSQEHEFGIEVASLAVLEEVKIANTPAVEARSHVTTQAYKDLYRETLEPLKVSSSSMADETGQIIHAYASEGSQPPDDINTARVNKEIKMLKRGLPMEPEASFFVCIDEKRMDLLKVLISGAVGTPYAHGLYQFDVSLPQNYPINAPLFKLMTTGGGNAYFGPNLYSCGYVCLSVINTWSGDPEEMWNAERSSILQVLLSIQTLVMDCNILEKEPGYNGYPIDHPGNVAYCNIVRYLNMKFAILETVRNPPKEFKEAIDKHFTLKKREVLETLEEWTADAMNDSNSYGGDEGSGYNPWCSEVFNSKTPGGAWKELKDEIEKEFERFN